MSAILLVLGVLGAIGVGAYHFVAKKVYEAGIAQRDKEINAKYAPLLESHAAQIKDQKIAMLNARFARMGWKSLTQKELKRFDDQLELQDYVDQEIMDEEEIDANLALDDSDEDDE